MHCAASLFGTPIAGGIFDIVGNYDYSFYVAGGLFILASILGFAAQFLQAPLPSNYNLLSEKDISFYH